MKRKLGMKLSRLINIIKGWFTPREEMVPHEELYTVVPEPETPIYQTEHCATHSRYKKSCPSCQEVHNV